MALWISPGIPYSRIVYGKNGLAEGPSMSTTISDTIWSITWKKIVCL